ncbi:MAG: glycoside hydrolase family 2 TIM barrel-domain containing protein [Kiritimatiellia bacterium]|jgi:beta-galactosidase|nr:glycoside hydrolase family 2 TIM barrel-domain containing protein [Kiritimatiellia bacterium]
MRSRICIDFDWSFALGDIPEAMRADFDDTAWRAVDVPHDWSIEATPHPDNPAQAGGGFFPCGLGWYRKQIDIPADLGDRVVLVEFDGVYMNSEVWCNGHFCGSRPYGYSSFFYDLTQYVTAGESACIAVRVDNSHQKNSRWYSGSGIYRHVWLTLAGPVRVDHWGTYVTTPEVIEDAAVVQCAVNVVNETGEDAYTEVCAMVIAPEASEGGLGVGSHGEKSPCSRGRQTVDLQFEIANPQLWTPDTPHLYTLRIELKQGGGVIDCYDTRFGIRAIRFDANEGFFLNGQSLKLRGMNEHHDAGCLGAAVPDDVIRRRFRILKEMGCNAIRVAHNPASPAFLDLCDEMGLMVVEDAFDEWKDGKTPFGYGLYWDEWWERDLTDMIRRDRNHPCIVMWSVGNEIKEVREGRSEGLPVMKALRDLCHREDPTRPMTCGCCAIRETNAGGYGPLMDLVGYNGGGGSCFDYEKDHAAYPDRIIFASEVPHTLQTRGVYRTRTWYRDLARNPDVERLDVPHLTAEELFTGFDPHYQSSYDNALVRISSIDSWRLTKSLPFMCGEFRWTGFDYIGECYAWPAKSWNFGIIDLCGFPKDTYYFYQSQWTETPMVHVLPHWTWPGLEGRTIPVICYSNCERVELFLDDESLGVREMDDHAMQLRWDVEYQPGGLKAVGYRGGAAAATCVHHTASAPAAIELCCDEFTIRADRTGIAHVVVTIVDEERRFVPCADHDITFDINGSATLIGLENGDPTDTTNYKLNHRKAFNGMLLAIVQAGDETGTVTITAKAEGLEGAACRVRGF